jgi:hypothetical protein
LVDVLVMDPQVMDLQMLTLAALALAVVLALLVYCSPGLGLSAAVLVVVVLRGVLILPVLPLYSLPSGPARLEGYRTLLLEAVHSGLQVGLVR